MHFSQKEIFLAAILADWTKLDDLILKERDLILSIPVIENKEVWERDAIELSVLEILQMNYDCWFDLKNQTKLKNHESINPKKIFQDNQKSIQLVTQKFNFKDITKIKYENYSKLIWYMCDDEWFDKEEFDKFLKEGYKTIDLELINAAIKRNKNKVIELLNKGANPYIDPDDKTFDSEILNCLASDDGFHLIEYLKHYDEMLCNSAKPISDKDIFFITKHLYGTASSACLYNLIKSGSKIEK